MSECRDKLLAEIELREVFQEKPSHLHCLNQAKNEGVCLLMIHN